jgi:two-component sensor histidine kinase/PAS domain-containing protein
MPVQKLELPLPTPLLDSFLDLDQAVLDALPIGVYACDADGLILRVNRRAVELWGRVPRLMDPAQRFCGSFRVESLDGKLIPPDQTPIARVLQTGESLEGAEAVVRNPDGKRWVARVTVAPLRDRNGELVGAINCFQDVTREHEMRAASERQQRTFDLAMVASKMGTWRYTMADNICVYDENAQRLYGLTEARFLHDENGVKEKFHPDDMDLMWARVAAALDPNGDGRYEVEYRVKQLDGSWRWLSAWGLVEFEGEGADRKPVAIAGASRDLTELKRAEELQRLLINELNHRVKNTLATVQSLVLQTLRGAADLASARTAVSARIIALAEAHDLLTSRSWSGADVAEVVERAIAPFAAGQFTVEGPSLDLPPKEALALSLALHELATNAAKYGALSRPEGRVELRWRARDGELHLEWRESGGPPVAPPVRRGFGTRLLEDGLSQTRLDFAPGGVVCATALPFAPTP